MREEKCLTQPPIGQKTYANGWTKRPHGPETSAQNSTKYSPSSNRLNAAGPQAQTAPLTHPTFCGYRCSWDIDDAGWPSYIHLEDGSLASHREKQGHHWYSVSLGDGKYGEHYLKFHRATPPEGLLVMPPPAALDDAQAPAPAAEETPFGLADEARLRVMHQLGRVVHGEDWPKHGRELILAQSDGRTETSAQLTQAEVESIISLLRQEQKEAA